MFGLNITLRNLFFGGLSKSNIDTSYTILRNKSMCIANDVKPFGLWHITSANCIN